MPLMAVISKLRACEGGNMIDRSSGDNVSTPLDARKIDTVSLYRKR
jgi:hypothetical protein